MANSRPKTPVPPPPDRGGSTPNWGGARWAFSIPHSNTHTSHIPLTAMNLSHCAEHNRPLTNQNEIWSKQMCKAILACRCLLTYSEKTHTHTHTHTHSRRVRAGSRMHVFLDIDLHRWGRPDMSAPLFAMPAHVFNVLRQISQPNARALLSATSYRRNAKHLWMGKGRSCILNWNRMDPQRSRIKRLFEASWSQYLDGT